MHAKEARAAGEKQERLDILPAWQEATVFTDPERAALALAEALTFVADDHVPEAVEAAARAQFDATSYAALVVAVATINTWNRVVIAAHSPAGTYTVPQSR